MYGYNNIPKNPSSGFNVVKANHLLEVIIICITKWGVWKISHFSMPKPRHQSHKQNAINHASLDILHQPITCDDEANKAQPELWALQFPTHAGPSFRVHNFAGSDGNQISSIRPNKPDTEAGLQAREGDEKPDPSSTTKPH